MAVPLLSALPDRCKDSPVLNSEYEDKELSMAIDRYKWSSLGEYSSWIHVCSKYLNLEQSPYPKIEHRLYLDTEGIYTHKMASYFIEKCEKYKIPYYFKFDENGNRDDTLVIYSSTENLTKYIEILREIQKEHPDFISKTKEPPILTGKIDGWIGYGTEPAVLPDGKRTSFNELRANTISKVIVEQRKIWIENNLETKFEHNGQLITVKEYIIQKAIDDMFTNMQKKLKTIGKNPPLSLQEQKEKHGYSEQDLNNPLFKDKVTRIITDQIDKYFKGEKKSIEGIKFVSWWTTTPSMSKIFQEFTPKIVEIDPSFIKKIQEKIKEESKNKGIDPDKYCFDLSISNEFKKNTPKQKEQSLQEEIIPIKKDERENIINQTELTNQQKEELDCLNKTLALLKRITPTKSTEAVIKSFEMYIKENYETSKTQPKETEKILEEVRKEGESKGKESAQETEINKKEETKEVKNVRKNTIHSDFIIDNLTGEVIDQRNKTLYERVKNVTRATGECDYLNDETITNKRNSSCKEYLERYIPTLSNEKISTLKQVYGDKWQETLQNAYIEGYNAGLKMCLEKGKTEGKEIREINKQKIENNEEILEQPSKESFDKLKFIYENFKVEENEKEEIEVKVKDTNQTVISKRTKNMVLFSKEWIKATGSIEESGQIEVSPSLSFSNQSEEIYRFMFVQIEKNINETGNINVENLRMNAEIMGSNYERAINILFRNEEVAKLVDSHFRMQIPNVKEKTEPIINIQSNEQHSLK